MDIQWSLVLFTALTGTAGWLFFFTGLNVFTRRSTSTGFMPGAVALALAIAGGLASVTHLAHPERMMGALAHPTSGIFTEAVLTGLFALCIVVFLVGLKRNQNAAVRVGAVGGMVFGVLLSFMAGYSYIMAARAAWFTILLPCGYLATAVPAGAALYGALLPADDEGGARFSTRTVIAGGAVAAIGVAAYAAASGSFVGAGAPYAVLALCLAGVVPVAVGVASMRAPVRALAWVAFAAALVGAVLYRVMMWIVGTGFYNFFD